MMRIESQKMNKILNIFKTLNIIFVLFDKILFEK